jgi:hypothetical protein
METIGSNVAGINKMSLAIIGKKECWNRRYGSGYSS